MTNFTSTIYCNNLGSRDILVTLNSSELKIQRQANNENCVTVNANLAVHDAFLSILKKNDDFVIFHDSKHIQSKQKHFKSYLKKAPEIKSEIKPEIKTSVQISRTAKWFSSYYNFPVTTSPAASAKVPATPIYMAVISLGGGYLMSDIKTYCTTMCGQTASQVPSIVNIPIGQASVPTFSNSDEDFENTLDLEILSGATTWPAGTIIFFLSAPNTTNGFLNAFSTAINGIKIGSKVYQPTTISNSWGQFESSFTVSEMQAYNSVFARGAAKNVTVLVASGDDGSNDGDSKNTPTVDFPASSPWVVAVGGTSVSLSNETAWSWNPINKWGGGGGVSNIFTMPAWQNGLVNLPVGTSPSVTHLVGKRALPDVALNADPLTGYTIFMGGTSYVNQIGGTSCAAPLMASLFGIMNLKFPISAASSLYHVYSKSLQRTLAFKDITSGSNDNLIVTNAKKASTKSQGVWNAATGFDMCTGLGSVNGVNLFNALKV